MDVNIILLALRSIGEGEIKPRIKNLGLLYEINGVELTPEKINEYRENDLLIPTSRYSYPACGVCNSTALHIVFECPTCKGNVLTKHDMIVHYECNHIAPAEEFKFKHVSTLYTCPRCGKQLSKVGIDYGRPGFGFMCEKCKFITQYPVIKVECDNGHVSNIYDLNMVIVEGYKVSSAANSLASVYEELVTAAKILKNYGLNVDVLCKVTGTSGVVHIIPLMLKDVDMNIVIDYIPNPNDTIQWFKIIARSIDLPNVLSIVVTDKPIDANILTTFNTSRIRILYNKDGLRISELIVKEVLRIIENQV
ncbi:MULTISPECIES: hypothetical protein [Candidatus Nitrosocaldus]|jgi:endogenous inhibitor of DNA gyrase (YacG/DUF329 family)|uniref:C2H2-type domain-containing protein n=1 Tax=Candidatus Nitrosocaldus cavascurensis TaxID=2058097 RepID=A0A2K5AT24_9ARCH|nr:MULTISPECIES: hypothetical protein [Candidatus Nitrosocaldus]SPC34792.1 conserved protein of unknown function [Candidatus Nitrosocaldus cavascurensis]